MIIVIKNLHTKIQNHSNRENYIFLKAFRTDGRTDKVNYNVASLLKINFFLGDITHYVNDDQFELEKVIVYDYVVLSPRNGWTTYWR